MGELQKVYYMQMQYQEEKKERKEGNKYFKQQLLFFFQINVKHQIKSKKLREHQVGLMPKTKSPLYLGISFSNYRKIKAKEKQQ